MKIIIELNVTESDDISKEVSTALFHLAKKANQGYLMYGDILNSGNKVFGKLTVELENGILFDQHERERHEN